MKKRNQIMIIALCLLIVAGAYVTNREHNRSQTVMSVPSPSPKVYGEALFVNGENGDRIEEARLNRDRARAEALDLLREITGDPTSELVSLENAVQEMTRISEYIQQEGKLENEIAAKGLGRAVVYLTDSGACVTLETARADDISVLLSAVMEETGCSADQIKIIPIK